jgi:hypothetical protein
MKCFLASCNTPHFEGYLIGACFARNSLEAREVFWAEPTIRKDCMGTNENLSVSSFEISASLPREIKEERPHLIRNLETLDQIEKALQQVTLVNEQNACATV